MDPRAGRGGAELRDLAHVRERAAGCRVYLDARGARAVADAFLTAIASGSDVQRLMVMQWRQGGLPVVERQGPHVTGAVKVLHLHRRLPP